DVPLPGPFRQARLTHYLVRRFIVAPRLQVDPPQSHRCEPRVELSRADRHEWLAPRKGCLTTRLTDLIHPRHQIQPPLGTLWKSRNDRLPAPAARALGAQLPTQCRIFLDGKFTEEDREIEYDVPAGSDIAPGRAVGFERR